MTMVLGQTEHSFTTNIIVVWWLWWVFILSRLLVFLLFAYGLCMCATGIVLCTIYANNHLLFLKNVAALPVLCALKQCMVKDRTHARHVMFISCRGTVSKNNTRMCNNVLKNKPLTLIIYILISVHYTYFVNKLQIKHLFFKSPNILSHLHLDRPIRGLDLYMPRCEAHQYLWPLTLPCIWPFHNKKCLTKDKSLYCFMWIREQNGFHIFL